jgi:hypothetical protein
MEAGAIAAYHNQQQYSTQFSVIMAQEIVAGTSE